MLFTLQGISVISPSMHKYSSHCILLSWDNATSTWREQKRGFSPFQSKRNGPPRKKKKSLEMARMEKDISLGWKFWNSLLNGICGDQRRNVDQVAQTPRSQQKRVPSKNQYFKHHYRSPLNSWKNKILRGDSQWDEYSLILFSSNLELKGRQPMRWVLTHYIYAVPHYSFFYDLLWTTFLINRIQPK